MSLVWTHLYWLSCASPCGHVFMFLSSSSFEADSIGPNPPPLSQVFGKYLMERGREIELIHGMQVMSVEKFMHIGGGQDLITQDLLWGKETKRNEGRACTRPWPMNMGCWPFSEQPTLVSFEHLITNTSMHNSTHSLTTLSIFSFIYLFIYLKRENNAQVQTGSIFVQHIPRILPHLTSQLTNQPTSCCLYAWSTIIRLATFLKSNVNSNPKQRECMEFNLTNLKDP